MASFIARITCLGFAAAPLFGCASAISGLNREASFVSNPEVATVVMNGRVIGSTPITLSLKDSFGQLLVFSKKGFDLTTVRVGSKARMVYEYSGSRYMVTLAKAGSGNMDRYTSLSPRQKAKDFIVVEYSGIMAELLKGGGGEYLPAMFSVLGVPENQRGQATRQIRVLLDAHADIPNFVDHVIEAYMRDK